MKRRTLLLAALLAMALAAFLMRERWYVAPAPIEKLREKAFFRAEWGMTPQQVAQVNGAALTEPSLQRRFYQPESGMESGYKTLEAPGRFLGRPSTISYTFKDEALISYHLFVSDSDADSLDEAMRGYLLKRFGPGAEEVEEGSLRMVWQYKDRIVNYWFYEEPNALSRPYRAGFGVQNRPE